MSITSPLNKISLDLSCEVFSHLDLISLSKCCQVSNAWNAFASQDKFWSIPSPLYPYPPSKALLRSHCVNSLKGIDYLAADYFKKTPAINARFLCMFPRQPHCSFEAIMEHAPLIGMFTGQLATKTVFFIGLADENSLTASSCSQVIDDRLNPNLGYGVLIRTKGYESPVLLLDKALDVGAGRIKEAERNAYNWDWTKKACRIIGPAAVIGAIGYYLYTSRSK